LHAPTTSGFIQGLYHDLLGRGASQDEMNATAGIIGGPLPILSSGQRTAMALRVLKSEEFREKTVVGFYFTILSRTGNPLPDETQFWANSSLSVDAIHIAFMSSSEAYNQ